MSARRHTAAPRRRKVVGVPRPAVAESAPPATSPGALGPETRALGAGITRATSAAFWLLIVIALGFTLLALLVLTRLEAVTGCTATTTVCTPSQTQAVGGFLAALAGVEALLGVGVRFGRRMARRLTLVVSCVMVVVLVAAATKDPWSVAGVPLFAAPGVLAYWEQLNRRPAPAPGRPAPRPVARATPGGIPGSALQAVRWLMGRNR